MSWVSSAPSRNGLPPVTAWQAWVNPALAAGSRCLTSVSVATGPSARGRTGGSGRARQQLRQQLRRRHRLAHPDRAEHPDSELLQRARQQRQPPQRRRIGPMDIVDEQNCWTALPEVADQPHQPRAAACIASPTDAGPPPSGASARSASPAAPIVSASHSGRIRSGSNSCRAIPHAACCSSGLQRAHNNRRPVRARSPAGRHEQCRLTNAGRPLNHDHSPGPARAFATRRSSSPNSASRSNNSAIGRYFTYRA